MGKQVPGGGMASISNLINPQFLKSQDNSASKMPELSRPSLAGGSQQVPKDGDSDDSISKVFDIENNLDQNDPLKRRNTVDN